MKRRTLLTATGVAATASLGVAGCGGSGSDSGTIDFWSFYGDPFGDVLTEALNGFTKAKVKHRVIPYDDFNQTLMRSAAAGELPDIALISAFDTAPFAEAGIITDLSDRIKQWGQSKKYFEGSLSTTFHDDKQWGLPHLSDCYVLWYNTELVKEPPKTWKELSRLATDLSEDTRYGIALSAVKGGEGATAFAIRLLSAGGDITKIDSAAGEESLRQWVDLVDDRGMSAEVLTMTEDDVKDRFAAGEAAMMINSASYVNILRDDHPDLKWKVATMPQDEKPATFLAQENLTITSGATDPDLAWELLTYLQKPDVLADYLPKRNKLPARSDLAEREPWSSDEVWQVFMEQLPSAWAPTGNTAAASSEVFTHIQGAIQAAVSGDSPIPAALSDAQAEIDKALKK